MRKIKETITALSSWGEPEALRIKREEQERMPEWHFAMAMKCAVAVSLIAAITVIIIFAETWKVIGLLAFGAFCTLILFMMKD